MVPRSLVVVWICVAVVSQSAPALADAAEVEALIAKGNELRRAGTPGPALPYFQRAYQLARTPRTSGQLGLAELAAGYPVEAAEHLASALETPNDPSIVKYRQMLTDALTMARAQIGELAIQGAPAGAEVVVNGRPAGVLPLSSAIKLPARNAEVVVRAPGHSERRELVPIAGGQRHELTVNLEKIEKPAVPSGQSVITVINPPPAVAPAIATAPVVVEHGSSDADVPGSSARTAAWLLGGGAIVAAGAGLALHVAARSNLSDFNASCMTDPTITPSEGGHLNPTECQDRHDAWESYRTWSVVGYFAGAALAVTSGILFLVSRPTPTPKTARAYFRCGANLNGAACHGVF